MWISTGTATLEHTALFFFNLTFLWYICFSGNAKASCEFPAFHSTCIGGVCFSLVWLSTSFQLQYASSLFWLCRWVFCVFLCIYLRKFICTCNMCACMHVYVCMQACLLCVCVCGGGGGGGLQLCTGEKYIWGVSCLSYSSPSLPYCSGYVCVCLSLLVCVLHVCVFVPVCVYIACVCVCVCMCVQVYTCMCVCVYVKLCRGEKFILLLSVRKIMRLIISCSDTLPNAHADVVLPSLFS